MFGFGLCLDHFYQVDLFSFVLIQLQKYNLQDILSFDNKSLFSSYLNIKLNITIKM